MELTREELCRYLAHLNLSDVPAATEDFLVAVTRAHLEVVPFENLEVHYERREPSLAATDLFKKVVENKRGGYCFELNKLFYLLLKEIGYTCYPVPARIVHRRTELRPVSHRATIVIVDGRKWFVDVGFGGAGPKGAIRMDTTEVQEVFGDSFVVTPNDSVYHGEYLISRIDDGIPERVMVFQENPWMDVDFTTFNSYYATYHRSPFKNKVVLYRCTPNGWVSLTDNVLTTLADGNRQIVELQTDQEIQDVIRQKFNLFVTPAD